MKNLDIHIVRREDIPSLTEFTNRIYVTKRNAAFYLWYFFDSRVDSILLGAFENNNIIGMFGMHKKKLSNGMMCGHIVGINVAPEYIGKGVFSHLCNYAKSYFNDLDLICIFANDAAVVPCEKSLGMTFVSEIRNRAVPTAALDGGKNKFQISLVQEDTVFEGYMQSASRTFFHYTPAYRHWRYASHPLYRYFKLSLDSGEYAVSKIFNDNNRKRRCGDIVDLECPLDEMDTIRRLITITVAWLKEQNADMASGWAIPGQPLSEVMDELGFYDDNVRTHFGIRTFSPGANILSSISSWHLRPADATNY